MTIRTNVMRGGLVVLAGLVVAGFSMSAQSAQPAGTVPPDQVRIGLEAPLSGAQKTLGISMLKGARFAAKQLNATGGINGKTVSIVPIDDAADPATGVSAAKAAIARGLSGVVGPYNSGVGIKTLPRYVKAGLVPIRLTSANVTQGFGYTLQPMTSQIAPVATNAVTSWLRATSVAVIYDRTQTYTKDANAAMKSALTSAGVTLTADIGINPGKKSYAGVVAKVDATHPQLVYVVTYYPEGGLIAKAMLDAKSAAKCLADFGAYDDGFVAAAGIPAAQNCPVVGVPAPGDFPDSTALVASYRKTFHAAPGTWAPYAYDSVNVLAEAARQAGGFRAEALISALDSMSRWQGWTGSVTFDHATGNRVPAPVVVDVTGPDGTLHVDGGWASATGFSF